MAHTFTLKPGTTSRCAVCGRGRSYCEGTKVAQIVSPWVRLAATASLPAKELSR